MTLLDAMVAAARLAPRLPHAAPRHVPARHRRRARDPARDAGRPRARRRRRRRPRRAAPRRCWPRPCTTRRGSWSAQRTPSRRTGTPIIAPRWPRIRAILEGDVVYRSLQLARGGAEALFADLEPRVRWADGVLYVDAKPGLHEVVDVAGRGLPLMPTIFASNAVTLVSPRPAAGHRLPGPRPRGALAGGAAGAAARARGAARQAAGDAARAARPPVVDDGARRPARRDAERRQPAPAGARPRRAAGPGAQRPHGALRPHAERRRLARRPGLTRNANGAGHLAAPRPVRAVVRSGRGARRPSGRSGRWPRTSWDWSSGRPAPGSTPMAKNATVAHGRTLMNSGLPAARSVLLSFSR